jgi:hypothetical protein
MQPLSASCRQSSGVKDFSKRMLPHQEIARLRRASSSARALRALGGAASSTKWKPVWPVSCDHGLDAVHQQLAALAAS